MRTLKWYYVLAAVLFPFAVWGAATGYNANVIKTAAPGAVDVGGTTATQGSALDMARADHNHSITGTLAVANGGTGATTASDARGTLGVAAATHASTHTVSGSDVVSINTSQLVHTSTAIPVDFGGTGCQNIGSQAGFCANNNSSVAGWVATTGTTGFLVATTGAVSLRSTGIINGDIASGAVIARNKLATDTAYGVVINDSGGVLSNVNAVAVGSALTSNGVSAVPVYRATGTCSSSAATTCTITSQRSGCLPVCSMSTSVSTTWRAAESGGTITCTFGTSGTNTCNCHCF